MAISELMTGTFPIDTNERSLVANSAGVSANTTDGVYQAFLDVSDMIAGDILQIRIYEKARSGDTQRLIYESILRDAQVEPMWVSPSLIMLHGWDVTADALAGTITVNWSIRQVV